MDFRLTIMLTVVGYAVAILIAFLAQSAIPMQFQATVLEITLGFGLLAFFEIFSFLWDSGKEIGNGWKGLQISLT